MRDAWLKAAWDESKHPRDLEGEGGGRFTSGGGAGSPAASGETAPAGWSAEARGAVQSAVEHGYGAADMRPRESPGRGLEVGLVHPSGLALSVNRHGEWTQVDQYGDPVRRGRGAAALSRRLARARGAGGKATS
ncbi:MAG: hypothetical protein AAB368_14450 [bacterium]